VNRDRLKFLHLSPASRAVAQLAAGAESPALRRFLRTERHERAPLVPIAPAAESMGRTVDELVTLARAGIVECAELEGEITHVRPIRLRGGVPV
jgi:hypothetical protein